MSASPRKSKSLPKELKREDWVDITQEAKRDFLIVFNEFRIQIKKGKIIGEIPVLFVQNLKTEEVID